MKNRSRRRIDFFKSEIKNFEDIAARIKPMRGEVPEVPGIEIYGEEIPYNHAVGGDHIIYVSFNKRYDLDYRIKVAEEANQPDVVKNLKLNKKRAGVLLSDAAGHNITDALLSAMLHQAFLTGVQYELKHNGQVTPEIFEILNTRFFNSASLSKFITLIYGEIDEKGTFKFLNAGHPPPVVFSNQFDKLITVCYERVINYPPIGTLPSKEDFDSVFNFSRLGYKKKYSLNNISLMGKGDILLLYTDGLCEHTNAKDELYFPGKLEMVMKKVKNRSAKEIYTAIKDDVLAFGKPDDDISYVVIKRV